MQASEQGQKVQRLMTWYWAWWFSEIQNLAKYFGIIN